MPRGKTTPAEETPKGPITSFEVVERPVTTRGVYQMDAETKALMDTVGTGKAVRLHIDERVDLHKIHMALRHAMKRADLSLHYKKVGERTLLAWAEKVSKVLVMTALLMELVTGCASAARAQNLQDQDFTTAWNACVVETRGYAAIPDYGITYDNLFLKCMEKAGWVQTPRWNAKAIGRYHRAP